MSEKNETVTEKLARLSEQVAWFESEEFALEEAIERFKASEKLAGEIEDDLLKLKNEINVLKKRFDKQ